MTLAFYLIIFRTTNLGTTAKRICIYINDRRQTDNIKISNPEVKDITDFTFLITLQMETSRQGKGRFGKLLL